MQKITFVIFLILGLSLIPASFSEEIPSWVKNNASWWSERTISQSEFTDALEFLINEGIIFVPPPEESPIPGPDKIIPDWVRNTAGWWSQNLIPDSEFINAMKYLINIGIIDVNASTPVKTIESTPEEDVVIISPLNIVMDGSSFAHQNKNFILDTKVFDSENYSGTEYSVHRKGLDNVDVTFQLFNEDGVLIHTFDDVTKYGGFVNYTVIARETSQERSGMGGGGLWLINNIYTVKISATLGEQYGEAYWEFVGVPHEGYYNQAPSTSFATAYNTNASSFYHTLDISSSVNTPEGLIFSKNGSRMYVPDNNDDKINQFKLTTAWDVSTAVLEHTSAATGEGGTDHVEDLAFSSDGYKMYIIERDSDKILEYNLSIPWDISASSMSDANSDYTIDNGITNNPEDIAFNSDGTKMYILDNDGAFDATETGDQIFEYDLNPAWDVSEATIVTNGHFTIAETNTSGGAPDAFEFSTDGKLLFVVDPAGFDRLIKYRLTTPWDVSSAKNDAGTTNLVDIVRLETQQDATKGLAFGDNGRKFYITGKGSDGSSPSVSQWNLP